ncbi:hypothetical protein ACF1AB_30050 [Streptomyces sp. NPDC014846]|uniref:hypothetical protein n=1 Tax=Streptomyces sp. NPDC014846 TaxID=3364922 RepID=UPI0036FD10C2
MISRDLTRPVVHLSVWGPEEGAEACTDLHTTLSRQFRALLEWLRDIAGNVPTEAAEAAYWQASGDRRTAYAKLLLFAQRALRDGAPPQLS